MGYTPSTNYGWSIPDSLASDRIWEHYLLFLAQIDATVKANADAAAAAVLPYQKGGARIIKGIRLTDTSGAAIATTSGTTELAMPKYAMALPETLSASGRYRYRAAIPYTQTVAGDSFEFILRKNTAGSGTVIGQTDPTPFPHATSGLIWVDVLVLGDAALTTIQLSVLRVAGTGTLTYFAAQANNYRAWASLEAFGDGTQWTDVP